MNINKVSQSIASQSPEFLKTEYPLFNKFIEYYYRSQEKTGLGQNIINNFLQYLDIDKLDVDILDGATKIVEPIAKDSDTIVVESVDSFLDTNGSILIGDDGNQQTNIDLAVVSGATTYYLFKQHNITAHATDEMLSRDLVLTAGEILKIEVNHANINVFVSLVEYAKGDQFRLGKRMG